MDIEIDRAQGLHSIPRRFGIANALRITRGCHLGSVVLLVWLGLACGLGPLYYLGVAVVAACSPTRTRSSAPTTSRGWTWRS